MADDFLKFENDKLGLDDFSFDINSTIPEHELLDLQNNNFNINNNDTQGQEVPQPTPATHLDPVQLLRDTSVNEPSSFHNSFHNSYISPVNSPYTNPSHLSTSFQPQRKDSIYDTLESIASPQQETSLNSQYFSPPAHKAIPLNRSRQGSHHLPPSSLNQNFNNSLNSPGSFNDALSPYSSFDNFKSPRSMGASPGPGSSLPKQKLSNEEKIRRRREFHNQVERRRRDLIKEKIKELGLIVPPSLLYVDSEGKEVKASKSVIINKTVEYVVHLHKVLKEQNIRKQQLIAKIEELEGLPDVNNPTPGSQSGTADYLTTTGSNNGDFPNNNNNLNLSGTNSYGNSPIPNIKFESNTSNNNAGDLDFDVNELLKEHSETWGNFN